MPLELGETAASVLIDPCPKRVLGNKGYTVGSQKSRTVDDVFLFWLRSRSSGGSLGGSSGESSIGIGLVGIALVSIESIDGTGLGSTQRAMCVDYDAIGAPDWRAED